MANPNTNPVTTSTVNAVAATLPVNGAVNAVATTNGDATNAHANAVNHTQAANEAANEVVNEAANEVVNSVRHCPHCRQPIALITLVVPPAAAFVTVPTPPTKATLRPADTHPAGRPT
jgi:hypothetical protein